MKLISVIIAWCSCKGPGRSHLLLMAYVSPVPLQEFLLSKQGFKSLSDALQFPSSPHCCQMHPFSYPQTSSYISLQTQRNLPLPDHFPAPYIFLPHLFCNQYCPFQCPKRPRLGKSCPWCRSTSARGQTEKGSSRFCSATDLAHHLRQIS